MAEQIIKNEVLELVVSEHGAELVAIRKAGKDCLWNADPTYWGRTSPVLFPFVGRENGGVYRHQGKEYPMGAHGFARDKEFTLISQTETELWYRLTADDTTKEVYPFDFALECGYRLEGSKVEVLWKVTNAGAEEMLFGIGAHPAFLLPESGIGECYLAFDNKEPLKNTGISENGLALPAWNMIETEDGMYHMTEHTFDADALVLEHDQVHRISICNAKKEPCATVTFDAPLVGIWAPAKKGVPFVCIEPWFGRCDPEGYTGELQDKPWINSIEPGKTWSRSYTITIA